MTYIYSSAWPSPLPSRLLAIPLSLSILPFVTTFASRPARPARAAVAALTAVAFLTPLGTPALCARQHDTAQQATCHDMGDAATHATAPAPGHGTVAAQHDTGDDCADMPWCGIVPMAPLRDLQHPVPETPDHGEAEALAATTALQITVPTATPPPRA